MCWIVQLSDFVLLRKCKEKSLDANNYALTINVLNVYGRTINGRPNTAGVVPTECVLKILSTTTTNVVYRSN